jgi:hypothetical protein
MGNVERFVRQAGPFGKRYDLFGFIDAIALYPKAVYGLQVTSDNNLRSRVAKILEERPNECRAFLASGGRVEVWGWAKKGKAGERKLWVPRVEEVYVTRDGDLISAPVSDPGRFPRPRRR